MCLYTNYVRNPKYKSNGKNGGNIPYLNDRRVLAVPVKCGKCIECCKSKQREWSIRLGEELKHNNKKGRFITLTFSTEQLINLQTGKDIDGKIIGEPLKEEGYELDNATAKLAMRRFLERWRKKYGKSVLHWCITELGGGRYEHLHIHGIFFTDVSKNIIHDVWKYGYIWEGDYCNNETVNYIVKYLGKLDENHKTYVPVILNSKGIGKGYKNSIGYYNNRFRGKDTFEFYVTESGHKLPLPTYYRNMLYNDEQKEELWIHKINKKIMYVDGIEIDVSNEEGFNEYYKLLKETRKLNTRYGYGKPSNYKEKKAENTRRVLLQMERRKSIEKIIPKLDTESNTIKPYIPNVNEW